MKYSVALQKLRSIGQESLLDNRTHDPRILQQIEALDLVLFKKQQQTVFAHPSPLSNFEAYTDYAVAGNSSLYQSGKNLIAENAMGCLIVAGGQGTRLGFNHPKGMYPISPLKHKSLFQLFAEKTLAAGKEAGHQLPIAIMTSPLNHAETVQFFYRNHFFGLAPDQVSFFSQGMLPFLDRNGNLMQTPEGLIAEGPDGNGSSLTHFWKQGIGDQWMKQGVRAVNFVLIDNALADPFDAELLGFHTASGNEVTLKCTWRKDPEEKVGVVVKREGRLSVVEYGEFSDPDFTFRCANLSLMCLDIEFVRQIALKPSDEFPLHATWKTLPNEERKGWKFERFIFDILTYAKRGGVLLVPREKCFAPLKNGKGADSPETVRAALMQRDRAILEEITGFPLPDSQIEIAQEFYYPTRSLFDQWKGTLPPSSGFVSADV